MWVLQVEFVQFGVEKWLCDIHDNYCDAISVLQRFRGAHRSRFFLAVDGLFPDSDVYCENQDTKVLFHMDLDADS